MTRTQYFNTLLEMFEEHIEEKDVRTEHEIADRILDFIENNAVPEPPDALEPDAWAGGFADNH